MAMMKCRECGKDMSDSARACPGCGWKRPTTKWWLWVPLALVAAFLLFGASIPEYKGRAMEARALCEKMAAAGATTLYECDRAYSAAIEAGRTAKSR